MAESKEKKHIAKYDELVNPNIDKETVGKLYGEWAETYDQAMGVMGEGRKCYMREIVDELFNKDYSIKILDAGAGTGIAGQILYEAGYKNLEALDASSEMLEKAKSKNVYQRFICDYLGPNKLDINSGTYDLIFCIGSLISSHINEDAFEEMIRITKPGGFVVFMIGLESIGEGRATIEASMQKLHNEGKWEWKINRVLNNYMYHDKGSHKGLQYVFKTK